MTSQRGGFVMGLVLGLLVGLALALGVALYVTKAPVPFINKVPQRTAQQDSAETERNRSWDPNAPLAGKAGARAGAASGAVATPASGVPGATRAAPAPGAASAPGPAPRDPAALLGGRSPPAALPASAAVDAFVFFVQAGAYARSEDAEQQRARLALLGQVAKISEREQAGRTVYRVRLGPFPNRDEADALQLRLKEQVMETQIVRVERP